MASPSDSTSYLEDQVEAFYKSGYYPSFDQFADLFIEKLGRYCIHNFRRIPCADLGIAICTAATNLYAAECFSSDEFNRLGSLHPIDEGAYRDLLLFILSRADNHQSRLDDFLDSLIECFDPLLHAVPYLLINDDEPEGQKTAPLMDVVPDLGGVITQMQGVIFQKKGTYRYLREILEARCESVVAGNGKRVAPTDYKGTNQDIIDAYLADTPFHQMFLTEVPVLPLPVPEIGEEQWCNHCLLLAQSGSGKTNVIQWRIANLLPLIKEGKASLILMEPKGVLTRELISLVQQEMPDRLVVIEPGDPDIAINLFQTSDNSRQGMNAALKRIARLFSTITASMTGQQQTTFQFAMRAALSMPPPVSIRTVLQILRRGLTGLPTDNLSPGIIDFFENDFHPGKDRANEIINRLNSFVGDAIFEPLLTAEKTTFDTFAAMQRGSVIVINVSAADELYGRFWIEEVGACVNRRFLIAEEQRTPTTFIIDEAEEYLSKDENFARILRLAREARIGMLTAAHQMEDFIGPVRHAMYTDMAIKLVAKTSADIHYLCRSMGVTRPEFISTLNRFEFAFFGPDMEAAEKVKFPRVELRKMIRASTPPLPLPEPSIALAPPTPTTEVDQSSEEEPFGEKTREGSAVW